MLLCLDPEGSPSPDRSRSPSSSVTDGEILLDIIPKDAFGDVIEEEMPKVRYDMVLYDGGVAAPGGLHELRLVLEPSCKRSCRGFA